VTWRALIHLRRREFDYLGHVTATAYLEFFEETRVAWMAEVTGDSTPAYVLARQEIDYLRELRLDDSPITIELELVKLGGSSMVIHETLRAVDGTERTRSVARMVRWDRNRRVPMPFPEAEHAALREWAAASASS
jgi:acyl-CoA thioester hydrolase